MRMRQNSLCFACRDKPIYILYTKLKKPVDEKKPKEYINFFPKVKKRKNE